MNAPLRHPPRWRPWAATAVLILMLGPFALSVTGCFTLASLTTSSDRLEPQLVPAGDAIHLEPGRELRLHLRNGSTVRGRFLGRVLLDRATYELRFAAASRAGVRGPLELDETLIVGLADGRRIEAPFGGYAMRALLLRTRADSTAVRFPFPSVVSIRRTGGTPVSIDSLLLSDLRGELPSAEAVAIEELAAPRGIADFDVARREVPLEEIQMAVVAKGGKKTPGLILAGVAADIVLFVIIRELLKPRPAPPPPDCEYSGGPWLGADDRVTERPFDRRLGRFVGEDVAWGDSTLAPPEAGEAAAAPLASPADSAAASSGGEGFATGWR